MSPQPTFPNSSQHIALAGRTGSGKSVAALDMLVRRPEIPWLIVDHKGDDNIKLLPADKMGLRPLALPSDGLHVVRPKMNGQDREDLEDLLHRVFKRGKMGVYIDEGHLMGMSEAVRNIMVAGRSKRVPMMWCSQRAHHIDTFIWSQCTFYRVFRLQGPPDIRRFDENFPQRWTDPGEYQSHYYDGTQGKSYLLAASPPITDTVKILEQRLLKNYRRI